MLQKAAGLSVERSSTDGGSLSLVMRSALLSSPHPTEASRKETETIKGRSSSLLHGLDRCGAGREHKINTRVHYMGVDA